MGLGIKVTHKLIHNNAGGMPYTFNVILIISSSGIILWMHPANERWRYIVTSSLIGWVHTQNDPCIPYIKVHLNNNKSSHQHIYHWLLSSMTSITGFLLDFFLCGVSRKLLSVTSPSNVGIGWQPSRAPSAESSPVISQSESLSEESLSLSLVVGSVLSSTRAIFWKTCHIDDLV